MKLSILLLTAWLATATAERHAYSVTAISSHHTDRHLCNWLEGKDATTSTAVINDCAGRQSYHKWKRTCASYMQQHTILVSTDKWSGPTN